MKWAYVVPGKLWQTEECCLVQTDRTCQSYCHGKTISLMFTEESIICINLSPVFYTCNRQSHLPVFSWRENPCSRYTLSKKLGCTCSKAGETSDLAEILLIWFFWQVISEQVLGIIMYILHAGKPHTITIFEHSLSLASDHGDIPV